MDGKFSNVAAMQQEERERSNPAGNAGYKGNDVSVERSQLWRETIGCCFNKGSIVSI